MRDLRVVHLISSGFYGGPERQIVALAARLAGEVRSTIVTFADHDRGAPLRRAASDAGLGTAVLRSETPGVVAMIAEVRRLLVERRADLLVTHHYKADLVGRPAATLARIPCCSVSHGWTAESRAVRLGERLDRVVLRTMDRVICVSDEQRRRVEAAGTRRTVTIRNAIEPSLFGGPDPAVRAELATRFARTPRRIFGAVGRLSPEKGFDVLVDAAARLDPADATCVIVFGDGAERKALARRIDATGLGDRFVLAGFDADVRGRFAGFDAFVSPSHTEGLPVVVLEAMASSLPVVATAVGGTPEVVRDGATGLLVPPGDPVALANGIRRIAADSREFGAAGRRRVVDEFSVAAQASACLAVWRELARAKRESHPSREETAVAP